MASNFEKPRIFRRGHRILAASNIPTTPENAPPVPSYAASDNSNGSSSPSLQEDTTAHDEWIQREMNKRIRKDRTPIDLNDEHMFKSSSDERFPYPSFGRASADPSLSGSAVDKVEKGIAPTENAVPEPEPDVLRSPVKSLTFTGEERDDEQSVDSTEEPLGPVDDDVEEVPESEPLVVVGQDEDIVHLDDPERSAMEPIESHQLVGVISPSSASTDKPLVVSAVLPLGYGYPPGHVEQPPDELLKHITEATPEAMVEEPETNSDQGDQSTHPITAEHHLSLKVPGSMPRTTEKTLNQGETELLGSAQRAESSSGITGSSRSTEQTSSRDTDTPQSGRPQSRLLAAVGVGVSTLDPGSIPSSVRQSVEDKASLTKGASPRDELLIHTTASGGELSPRVSGSIHSPTDKLLEKESRPSVPIYSASDNGNGSSSPSLQEDTTPHDNRIQRELNNRTSKDRPSVDLNDKDAFKSSSDDVEEVPESEPLVVVGQDGDNGHEPLVVPAVLPMGNGRPYGNVEEPPDELPKQITEATPEAVAEEPETNSDQGDQSTHSTTSEHHLLSKVPGSMPLTAEKMSEKEVTPETDEVFLGFTPESSLGIPGSSRSRGQTSTKDTDTPHSGRPQSPRLAAGRVGVSTLVQGSIASSARRPAEDKTSLTKGASPRDELVISTIASGAQLSHRVSGSIPPTTDSVSEQEKTPPIVDKLLIPTITSGSQLPPRVSGSIPALAENLLPLATGASHRNEPSKPDIASGGEVSPRVSGSIPSATDQLFEKEKPPLTPPDDLQPLAADNDVLSNGYSTADKPGRLTSVQDRTTASTRNDLPSDSGGHPKVSPPQVASTPIEGTDSEKEWQTVSGDFTVSNAARRASTVPLRQKPTCPTAQMMRLLGSPQAQSTPVAPLARRAQGTSQPSMGVTSADDYRRLCSLTMIAPPPLRCRMSTPISTESVSSGSRSGKQTVSSSSQSLGGARLSAMQPAPITINTGTMAAESQRSPASARRSSGTEVAGKNGLTAVMTAAINPPRSPSGESGSTTSSRRRRLHNIRSARGSSDVDLEIREMSDEEGRIGTTKDQERDSSKKSRSQKPPPSLIGPPVKIPEMVSSEATQISNPKLSPRGGLVTGDGRISSQDLASALISQFNESDDEDKMDASTSHIRTYKRSHRTNSAGNSGKIEKVRSKNANQNTTKKVDVKKNTKKTKPRQTQDENSSRDNSSERLRSSDSSLLRNLIVSIPKINPFRVASAEEKLKNITKNTTERPILESNDEPASTSAKRDRSFSPELSRDSRPRVSGSKSVETSTKKKYLPRKSQSTAVQTSAEAKRESSATKRLRIQSTEPCAIAISSHESWNVEAYDHDFFSSPTDNTRHKSKSRQQVDSSRPEGIAAGVQPRSVARSILRTGGRSARSSANVSFAASPVQGGDISDDPSTSVQHYFDHTALNSLNDSGNVSDSSEKLNRSIYIYKRKPAKKDIIVPAADAAPGCRRSQRSRCPRVNLYIGESAVYEWDPETRCQTLVGVRQNDVYIRNLRKYGQLMPTRAHERYCNELYKKAKSKLGLKKTKRGRKPKRLSMHIPKEDLAGVSGIEAEADDEADHPVIVKHPVTGEEVEMACIARARNEVRTDRFGNPAAENDEVVYSKMITEAGFVSGCVYLRPFGTLVEDSEASDCAKMYDVIKGKVILYLNGKGHVLEKGDQFQVPPGNLHSLKNTRRDEAKLNYKSLFSSANASSSMRSSPRKRGFNQSKQLDDDPGDHSMTTKVKKANTSARSLRKRNVPL